jgi:hypothetical protein
VTWPTAPSEDEVRSWGSRCKVEQAAWALGVGKHKAYEEIKARGRLVATVSGRKVEIPAYQVCDRWWVQTRPIREVLGMEPSQ